MATTRKTGNNGSASSRPTAASNPKASDMASLGDLGKLIEKLKLPGIDVAAIVDAQRKDMEALAEANKQAYEGIKALAQRRNEILRDALVEWQQAMQDAGKAGARQPADMAREGVQKAIANMRELGEMEAESRNAAWKVLQDRFEENVANLRKVLQPTQPPVEGHQNARS
jgi:phasin family protein